MSFNKTINSEVNNANSNLIKSVKLVTILKNQRMKKMLMMKKKVTKDLVLLMNFNKKILPKVIQVSNCVNFMNNLVLYPLKFIGITKALNSATKHICGD